MFLNGFEIDSPSLDNQVSFPSPENKFERVELQEGAATVSWRAPSSTETASYDIYIGSSPDSMEAVALGSSETSYEVTGQFSIL